MATNFLIKDIGQQIYNIRSGFGICAKCINLKRTKDITTNNKEIPIGGDMYSNIWCNSKQNYCKNIRNSLVRCKYYKTLRKRSIKADKRRKYILNILASFIKSIKINNFTPLRETWKGEK